MQKTINSTLSPTSTHSKGKSGNFTSKKKIQTQNQAQDYKLACQRHPTKQVEKVCTFPGCEFDVLLCIDCVQDAQQHLMQHKDNIFNYCDFIGVCRSLSLKFRDELGNQISSKQFNSLITELEKHVTKYKAHIKREEEKVDLDFDQIVQQFKTDLDEIKAKIKEQLQKQQEKFIEIAGQLRQKAIDLNNEKGLNQNYSNDFDEFLQNLSQYTQDGVSGQQSPKAYNFKKLIGNITPLINRVSHQYQRAVLGQQQSMNQSLVGPKSPMEKSPDKLENNNFQQNFDQISCFTGMTLCSNLTLNLGGNPHLTPLKDLFQEFKEMTIHRPQYRNKGEANKIYRDALSDARKIYYNLLEVAPNFVYQVKLVGGVLQQQPGCKENNQNQQQTQTKCSLVSGNVTTSLTNTQLMQSFRGPSLDGCDQRQNLDQLVQQDNIDCIELKQNEMLTQFDHIQTVQTTHKGGIFALSILNDQIYVTGSNDRSVKIWNFSDHSLVSEVNLKSDVTCISSLQRQDGSLMILVGLFRSFAVLNQGYQLFKVFEGEHDGSINCIIGLKDGQTVITCSNDNKLVAWNMMGEDVKPKKYFDHRDTIYALELFPTRDLLASGGRDRSIKIWRLHFYRDFKNNSLERLALDTNIPDAHTTDVTALKSSVLYPDLLLSGAANGEIKIWEVNEGTLLKSMKNYSGWVYRIVLFERPQAVNKQSQQQQSQFPKEEDVLSPRYLASGWKKPKPLSMCTSPMNKPSQQNKIKVQYQEQINNISFLSASFDGTIKVWEARQDAPVIQSKSKNVFECYPFGGVGAIKVEGSTKIHVLTTGNKNDSTVNVWALK